MGAPLRVDLNADLGERYDGWRPGHDEAVLDAVTTAHVACGVHSGDAAVMAETVAAALVRGVAVGAHPSYPDREGFGRRPMALGRERVRSVVLSQVGELEGIARSLGARLASVKPHGALYHSMAVDADCAAAVCEGVRDVRDDLWLVAPAGSVAAAVGRSLGMAVAEEAFCDRAYAPDGRLAARHEPGAVLTDPDEVAARALRLVRDHEVPATDGSVLGLAPTTVCIHGDTPGAPALARAVRVALESAGVVVEPFGPG